MQRTLTVRSWMVLLLVVGLCVGTTNAFAVISEISVSLDGPEQGWPNEALEYTATGSYTLDSGTQDEIDDNEASVTEEWEWTYAPASCSTLLADSNEETFAYAPAQAGTDQQIIVTYTVTVTFSDESQVSASRWATKFVHVNALLVSIIHPAVNPFTADIGTPTYFKARAEDSTGHDLTSQCTWEWDFGDETDSTENPTDHTYVLQDEYTVTVTATYQGLSAQDETEVDAQELGGGGANGGWTVDVVFDPNDPGGTKTSGTVCDTVFFVLDADLDDDAIPDCWIPICAIYKWDPDEGEFTGLEDGYSVGTPFRTFGSSWSGPDTVAWDSVESQNVEQFFLVKAWVEVDWDPELMEPIINIEYDVIGLTPENTVVKSPCTIVEHGGGPFSGATWTIEHLDQGDPKFDITVCIYGLSGGAQGTTVSLTNQDLSCGAIPAASQPDLPAGLYMYRVMVTHDNGAPGCCDTDKVDALKIDGVTIEDIDLRAERMTLIVNYRAGQPISSGRIRVYDPDLNQVGVVTVGPTQGDGSCTVQVPVNRDQCGGTLWPIISGTQADGSANRDLQPKPAIEEGGSLPVPMPYIKITEPNGEPVTDNHFCFDTQPKDAARCMVHNLKGECGAAWDKYQLEWSIDPISGSELSWRDDLPAPVGPVMIFFYTKLPASNNEFGDKTVMLSHPQLPDTDTATAQIFFPTSAKNNPDGEYPNWYYYWKWGGVVEDLADFEYDETPPPDIPDALGYWDGYDVFVCDGAQGALDAGPEVTNVDTHQVESIGPAQAMHGVDCCATVCVHELMHKMIDSWAGPDSDGDGVPDAYELSSPYNLNPQKRDTYEMHKIFSGYADIGDQEFLCWMAERNPGPGIVHPEKDWSWGGKNSGN